MWFFKNPLKEAQEKAKELIILGKKVYDYRRDLLSQSQCAELLLRIDNLKETCKEGHIDNIKKAYDQLHTIASACGGKMYPVTFWSENVEMLLVAAILAIGIRWFFIMPFKIPTNSMYPTYSGMVGKAYEKNEKTPFLLTRLIRFATLGASNYQMIASTEGRVSIPVFMPGEPMSGSGFVYWRKANGHKWFGLMPEPCREYVFFVDGKETTVQVPWDFGLDEVVMQAFFPKSETFRDAARNHAIEFINGRPCIATDLVCKQGEPVLRFDILTGDMLFVDRVSYNFRKPKVGEPFVFSTKNIPKIPDDKYYIKRVVGTPGDVLEVKEPVLYRNDEPITGAKAFELNFNKVGEYRGYTARGGLSKGAKEVVPPNHYYAMGDNSPYSGDSRYFGFVPEKDIVGKALFILHPFTNRWGIAK